jgi:hypothetical protein
MITVGKSQFMGSRLRGSDAHSSLYPYSGTLPAFS